MSRETTGSSAFTERGNGFRLWAGVVFVVIVAGLLAYVLPSPEQWRRSIGTFVAELLKEPAPSHAAPAAPAAPAEDDGVVWMSIEPEEAPTGSSAPATSTEEGPDKAE